MAVAVATLVRAGVVAQERRGAVAGYGPFRGAGHGRSVVAPVRQGGVAYVMGGGHEGDLSEEARLFQVTVGDGAGEVVSGDQLGGHFGGEGVAPDIGPILGVEVDSSHAHLGGVGGSQERGFLGDNFGEVRGAVA
jgi:hypothetical protein